MKTGPKPQNFNKAFAKIEARSSTDENGCFIWEGCTSGEGYGHIRCDNEEWYLHRLIYREFICSEVPQVVMHICDTPRCWNPEHLVGGTHADNVQDKVNKGRHNFGSKVYISKLNEEAVRAIRASQLSPPELAKKYGVHRASIHQVLNRQSWAHI